MKRHVINLACFFDYKKNKKFQVIKSKLIKLKIYWVIKSKSYKVESYKVLYRTN